MQSVEPMAQASRVPSPDTASGLIVMATISVVGLAAFLYPFFTADAPSGPERGPLTRRPLIFGVLAALAASLFVVELSSQGMNAKVASVLAVLTMCAAGCA